MDGISGSESLITIRKKVKNGVRILELDNLTEVYANSHKGDLVVVEGDHDIGANSIQLKDGVNWKFVGFLKIIGSSPNGVFTDNNVAVNVHFEGDVKIINTEHNNGIDDKINKQHANSRIHNIVFESLLILWFQLENASFSSQSGYGAQYIKDEIGLDSTELHLMATAEGMYEDYQDKIQEKIGSNNKAYISIRIKDLLNNENKRLDFTPYVDSSNSLEVRSFVNTNLVAYGGYALFSMKIHLD